MTNSDSPLPPLTLALEAEPDEASRQAISAGLDAFNDSIAPCNNMAPLWIIGRDSAGAAQAGLHAVTFFDWMFVRLLWVGEPYRKLGIGSDLLAQAETVARERGVANSFLDTFSFQAPGFYERHGYREFGRLDNQPPGHSRIWLAKQLQ